MRRMVLFGLAGALMAVLGCAQFRMAGTYWAEIQVMGGREESLEAGYSLVEVQERLKENPRTLVLESNRRYQWQTGDRVNEGSWRVEDDMLILRDDVSGGVDIQPALQKDREWLIRGDELVNQGTYGAHNLEEVYRKQ